jgi:AraC-like DNA-binding protein
MYKPKPPLADFVDCFWVWDGYTAPKPRERILPTGTVDLVINLRETELRIYDADDAATSSPLHGIVVCGAQSVHRVIDTPPDISVMGIHFKPGGASRFLGTPADKLTDINVPLDALWGRAGTILHERLLHARSHPERFRLLEAALRSKPEHSVVAHRAVEFALASFNGPGSRTVSDIQEQIGLSPKRFIELFRREVGLPPKLYCRIRRFQRALRLTGHARCVDWAGLALAAGYFDQAHFNRDFRALSGMTPGSYITQGVERANHVPVDG